MSFKAILCIATGEHVTPDSCIACARQGALAGCHLTAPIIKGIVESIRPDDFGLTATTVMSCARKWRLKIEHDYALDPKQSYWAFRGQIAHGIVAETEGADPQAIVEQRFSMWVAMPWQQAPACNPWVQVAGEAVVITGQPDLVYLDRKLILDYKTTKAVPQLYKTYTCPTTGAILREGQWRPKRGFVFEDCACGQDHQPRAIETVSPRRAYPGHIWQLSVYAVMLAEQGLAIQSGEIVYLDMAQTVRVPVTLIPAHEVLATLQARLPAFIQPDLPAVLPQENGKDNWACGYCPVSAQCMAIEQGQPVQAIQPIERAAHHVEALVPSNL